MYPIDVREISPKNRSERRRRLVRLRRSLEQQKYEISSSQLAGCIINEALNNAVSHRHADRQHRSA